MERRRKTEKAAEFEQIGLDHERRIREEIDRKRIRDEERSRIEHEERMRLLREKAERFVLRGVHNF